MVRVLEVALVEPVPVKKSTSVSREKRLEFDWYTVAHITQVQTTPMKTLTREQRQTIARVTFVSSSALIHNST